MRIYFRAQLTDRDQLNNATTTYRIFDFSGRRETGDTFQGLIVTPGTKGQAQRSMRTSAKAD